MWFNKVAKPLKHQRRLPLVRTIVQEIMEQFQQKIFRFFQGDGVRLAEAESQLSQAAKEFTVEMLQAYVQQLSVNLEEDRQGRRKAGLVIERKREERRLLTQLGEICFRRDYYWDKHKQCYRYPVDEALGIEKGMRISNSLGLALAGGAAEMSYDKSSRYVGEGKVSRQTVMNRLRDCQAKEAIAGEKRWVAALHIDADEDHVTMQGGKTSVLPLISIYEGIGSKGKRRYCKEVFHLSEYGLSGDELWEKVLSVMESRYELEDTVIYLHGDGAPWIKTGLEWLPNCRFVLDKYHKNKAIKKMCAGLDQGSLRQSVEGALRSSLAQGNEECFRDITESLCKENRKREKNIREAANYLHNHREAIAICLQEQEANNGGCTEPHVSHILSSRLSSRPLAWSKKTLVCLAPILAARGELEKKKATPPVKDPVLKKAAAKAKKVFQPKYTLGLVEPDAIGALTAINLGKKTPAFSAVYSFSR